MKKLTLSLLTACTVAAPAFAGVTVVTKEYKQPVVLPPPCFRDSELTLDLFYSFNDGRPGGHHSDRDNGRHHDFERFRDGSGGGVGLTWFFARYFGISVEGNWWDGVESRSERHDRVRDGSRWVWDDDDYEWRRENRFKDRTRKNSNRSVAHQVTGNFIIRYPVELCNFCFAPYIFGGGGGIFDGDKVGFGDVGGGVEWRATENFGVFADWRWNFTGKGRNDIDTTRAGIRFVF